MNREEYPRISDIMALYSQAQMDMIDPKILANACQRGTDVHSYCTAYAKGLWSLPPEDHLVGYVDSFKAWYDANVEELIATETRLYDDDLQFSGQFDLIVKLKGQDHHTLVDMKTSAAYNHDWPIKLSAYLHLLNLNDHNVFHAISLRLKKDGNKPCAKDFGDCNPYYKIFMSALTCYDYFIRKKEVA